MSWLKRSRFGKNQERQWTYGTAKLYPISIYSVMPQVCFLSSPVYAHHQDINSHSKKINAKMQCLHPHPPPTYTAFCTSSGSSCYGAIAPALSFTGGTTVEDNHGAPLAAAVYSISMDSYLNTTSIGIPVGGVPRLWDLFTAFPLVAQNCFPVALSSSKKWAAASGQAAWRPSK